MKQNTLTNHKYTHFIASHIFDAFLSRHQIVRDNILQCYQIIHYRFKHILTNELFEMHEDNIRTK